MFSTGESYEKASCTGKPDHPSSRNSCLRRRSDRRFAGLVPTAGRAENLRPLAVPANIQAPAGNKLFFVGHAVGTQNYICLPADGDVKFTLFTPQATLFKEQKQIITHYFSPNPFEGGAVRATWQHSKDTSTVWGKVADGNSSADPAYVAPARSGSS
ncbi:MAG: DUF3455 domain-containing protein [Caldilineaceae bacterium]